ncbi:hypothetical protein MAPG_01218 [Magnaporthiopsis poae ATCC 64411]|uniref:Uncharacterized protein n=1 Tax=Magnaporthiopsis poae (strain ATCC 64411 / 73-15) TaxID=644358 RepID=A0A0C4DN44_MAGP6|nr:hypothetical protein MAPG_01218 [Magnaporthiopsis poae ATCC 64411]
MTLFTSKRKPRAIRTFGTDDEDDHGKDAPSQQPQDAGRGEPVKEGLSSTTSVPVKFTKRPFKQSSLRKSINAEDAAALASDLGQTTESVQAPAPATVGAASGGGDEDEDGPVVVKPSLSRAGSTKQKKKRLSSRLSFGGDPVAAGDDDGGGGAFTTPKKAGLSSRALENSALRNRLPIGGRQPTASSSHAPDDDDDSRPRYSKEYLDELANSGGGNGCSSDGDDSEAERRAAYEEAQTRAGMDGLQRRRKDESGGGSGRGTGVAEIPRLKPLPDLDECLSRMREVLQGMERDVAAKQRRIAELEKEKSEITAREAEVQAVLDQEGNKYQAAPGSLSALPMPPGSAAQSPLRPLPAGFGVDTPTQRGLESFGTPTKRPDAEDVG